MKAPKLPKIPKKFYKGTPLKMTPELVLLGKQLLREGRSERFVAERLGVSRHTMRIHCKEGYREWFEAHHGKDWRPLKEKANAAARRRYRIVKETRKAELAEMHKQSYQWRVQKYGKEKLAEIHNKFYHERSGSL